VRSAQKNSQKGESAEEKAQLKKQRDLDLSHGQEGNEKGIEVPPWRGRRNATRKVPKKTARKKRGDSHAQFPVGKIPEKERLRTRKRSVQRRKGRGAEGA